MDQNGRMDAVYDVITAQAAAQNALLGLAKEKRAAVLGNDTEKLMGVVEQEYQILSQMDKIGKLWAVEMEAACDALGMSDETMTLRDLIAYTEDGAQKERLQRLHADMADTLDALKKQNMENRQLVEAQLMYTEMMLNILGGSVDPLNNFYGTDGRSSDAEITRGSSLFDTEI